jgi:hypothetical protein
LSRTDAHDPVWIQAGWWEPYHVRCEYDIDYNDVWYVCNLPDGPDLTRDRPTFHRFGSTDCCWEMVWDSVPRHRRPYRGRVSGRDLEGYWPGAERARVRKRVQVQVREFNTFGEVFDDLPCWQGRRAMRWTWD